MVRMLIELASAPFLVGGSTLVGRRWGAEIGGLVSAFPAVVGPVLLITAQQRGAVYTAGVANGTLLGLVALAGFVLSYAWVALRARWQVSLIAGWACSGVVALLLGSWAQSLGFPAGLVAATVSLCLARRAMPRSQTDIPDVPASDDLALRVLIAALLVALLAAAAHVFGSLLAGLLSGLPVLASVLAVFTHRRHGPGALCELLRGMLAGMIGFVGFCAAVEVLIVPVGNAPAFVAAGITAAGLELLVLQRRGHVPSHVDSADGQYTGTLAS